MTKSTVSVRDTVLSWVIGLQKKNECAALDGAGTEVVVDAAVRVVPVAEGDAVGAFLKEADDGRKELLALCVVVRQDTRPDNPVALGVNGTGVKGCAIGVAPFDIGINLSLHQLLREEPEVINLIERHVVFQTECTIVRVPSQGNM